VVLLVSCLASLIVVLDVSMVNVAIPSLAKGLEFSNLEQLWFINGYVLAVSGLPIVMGRLADLYGHRRVLLVGLVWFTLAGVGCAAAPNVDVIEAARAAQGIGGAVLASTSLSLITSAYPDGARRRRAIGVWSATVAAGAAVGVLLGGVVTAQVGWRGVFAVGSSVAAVTFVVAALWRGPADAVSDRRIDLLGAGLLLSGLGACVSGFIEVGSHGWGAPLTTGLLVLGVGVLVMFGRWEARRPDPLLPIRLVADRRRAAACLAMALAGCCLYFLYFAISVYLQRVNGVGPLRAGVLSLPAAVSVTLGSIASPLLARRTTPLQQLSGALLLLAGGFFWLSGLGARTSYWTHVGLPLVMIGIGLGVCFVPATILVTAGLPLERAGVGSGLVNTSRQLGRAIGLAALTGVLLSTARPGPAAAHAIAGGASDAFTACGVIAAFGSLAVWVLLHGLPLGIPSAMQPTERIAGAMPSGRMAGSGSPLTEPDLR
jgi:EmrB/QacA subfamily drug resistance transporter